MIRSFPLSDCKLVYSKNELGFQEVLNSFPTAKEITVVTYNISESDTILMKSLREAGEHCIINILTNIPNRWEEYYAQWCRDKAKKKINLYMSILDPQKFGHFTSVFFNFSNHSKIIMTDSVAYVGSENFSVESEQNSECGIISYDPHLIDFIKSEIFTDMKETALPYYEYDFTSLILEGNLAVSTIYNAKNRLYDEVYCLFDNRDEITYYYIDNEAMLSVQTLENLSAVIEDTNKIATDIYDAIGVILDQDEWDGLDSDKVDELYEAIQAHASRIFEIQSFESIVELSEFDEQDYINRQLQDDLAMDAYEENLECCVQIASDNATDKIHDLTLAAKEDIDDLLSEIDLYCGAFVAIINNLQSREIKKQNPIIDNT